jgi:murein L,D-transpeptidase YafK
MIDNLHNIVKEIGEKVNYDSSLGNKSIKKSIKKKKKQNPSLIERMGNRLEKYKKFMKAASTDGYDTKHTSGSGNNPCYNYPKVPPPLVYDPRYGRRIKNKHTAFATTAEIDGKPINLLETVGKTLYCLII